MNPQTQPIRVRITKSCGPFLAKVDQEYDVIQNPEYPDWWQVVDKKQAIPKSCCTIIQEPAVPPGIVGFKDKDGHHFYFSDRPHQEQVYDEWIRFHIEKGHDIDAIRDNGVE